MNCRSCAASAAPLPPPPQQSGAQKRRSAPRSCSCALSGAGHQNARAPRNGVSKGSGYSSIVLYINSSSSSRASHFLWTRPICSMLARGCAAAKSVWRSAQRAGLADNNFGPSPFCVDNCPVVPELFPVLSTKRARRQPFPSHKAQSPGSVEDSGLCQARRGGNRRLPLSRPLRQGGPSRGIYFAGAACGC